MKITGKLSFVLAVAVIMVLPVLLGACSGDGQTSPNAVPSFCPAGYATNLAIAPDGNTEPRAYYQDLDTTMGADLDITLLACDPDNPATAAGMTWTVVKGPFSGSLSAVSGTYSAQPYQVTYIPSGTGPDSFYFVCFDADGAISNVAEIRINVEQPPLTGQNLFFGGKDDLYRSHLWYYDGVSPIATVSGSAQALSQNDLDWFNAGVPYQDGVHFIVADSSGENLHVVGFDPGSQSFRPYPEIDNVGEVVEYGPLLYATGQAAGASTIYLWYIGSGGWTPIVGTAGLYPYDLAVLDSTLYFAGDIGGGNVQVMSYDSAAGELLVESAIGPNLMPRHLTACNGRLYFNGTLGPYQYLWSMDSVSAATTVTNGATAPENMTCFNSELYFTGRGAPGSTMSGQLWSVDDGDNLTRWTTNTFTDFMSAGSETYPVETGSMLYMRGNTDGFTSYIWALDGSSPMVTVPGSANLYPFFNVAFDGKLFFSSSATAYDQLWSYDPGTGSLGAISNISMGLYPRGFAVYTP